MHYACAFAHAHDWPRARMSVGKGRQQHMSNNADADARCAGFLLLKL